MAPKKAKRKAQVKVVPSQRQSNNQKQETKISIRLGDSGVAKKQRRRYVANPKAKVAPAPSTVITNYSQPNPVMYSPSASPYPYPAAAPSPAPPLAPPPEPVSAPISVYDPTELYGRYGGSSNSSIATYRGFPSPVPYPPFGLPISLPSGGLVIGAPRSGRDSSSTITTDEYRRVPREIEERAHVPVPSGPRLIEDLRPPVSRAPTLITSPSITPGSTLITQPVPSRNSLSSTLSSLGGSILSSIVSDVKSGRVTAPSSGVTVYTKPRSHTTPHYVPPPSSVASSSSAGSAVSSLTRPPPQSISSISSGSSSRSSPNSVWNTISTNPSSGSYSAGSIYYDRAYNPRSTVGGDKNGLFQNRQYYGQDDMSIISNKGYPTPDSSVKSNTGKKTMPVIIIGAPKSVSTVGTTELIIPQTVDKPISPRSVLTSSSMTSGKGPPNIIPFEDEPVGRAMPKQSYGINYNKMSAAQVRDIAEKSKIPITRPGSSRSGAPVKRTKADLINELLGL